jgi:hypothetical protein
MTTATRKTAKPRDPQALKASDVLMELRDDAASARSQADRILADLTKDMATNAGYAIRWGAEKLVAAQTTAALWDSLLAYLETRGKSEGFAVALREWSNEADEQVRRFAESALSWPTESASPIYTAVSRIEDAALARFNGATHGTGSPMPAIRYALKAEASGQLIDDVADPQAGN